jgi:hypothetical protein
LARDLPGSRQRLGTDCFRLSWQSRSYGCRSHHLRDGSLCGRAHLLDSPDRLSHRLRRRWWHCFDKLNSIGSLGGFAGPYAIGWIKDATGETTLGLVVLAACSIMAGVVTFLIGHDSKIEMAGRRMMAECAETIAQQRCSTDPCNPTPCEQPLWVI